MDGENFIHIILRDVVPVLDLRIVQDVCQSIFIEVHISDIIDGSGSVAMGSSPNRVDVDGLVCALGVF